MIRVTLIHPASRRFFLAQWDDPTTGRTKTRSTKTRIRRDAERFAGNLERDLNSGEFQEIRDLPWAQLRERYTNEVSVFRANKTKLKTQAMWNAIQRLCEPKMTSAVARPQFISKFAAALVSEQHEERVVLRKPFTIRGHLAELRKVLRWAKDQEIVAKVPPIKMPPKSSGMKGRPITREEFERIASSTEKVVLPQFLDGWLYYLEGMWLSSLRLVESMRLHWTSDRELGVDLSHRRPMFRIQATAEKGRQFRLLPMTPDFAEFLLRTPETDRHGFVFNPLTLPPGIKRTGSHRPTPEHVGRIISQIGEKAGVKVNETKFASVHDFRRSFGFRWAKIVSQKILQELMRHKSIVTTQEFYIGSMAEDAADEVWKASIRFGNTFGNTAPDVAQAASEII